MSTVFPPLDPLVREASDRRLFFVSGFDPKGPGYYQRLCFDEAGKRASRGRCRIDVSERRNIDRFRSRWTLTLPRTGAAPFVTQCDFLRWDDLVRRHWTHSFRRLLTDYAGVYHDVFRYGIFRRLHRIGHGPAFMTLFPLLTAVGFLGLGFALASAAMAAALGDWPLLARLPLAWLAAFAAWRIGERRLQTEWLLRLYGFTRAQARGRLPDVDERIDRFADLIIDAGRTSVREILVVGYSNGSIIAASALARAFERMPQLGTEGPGIAFLTLGHCTPVLASFPMAERFRAELRRLAGTAALAWVDYSSPADLAAFAGAPPWLGPLKGLKLRRSPRFHAAMSREDYRRLKDDRRALHLHYLKGAGPLARIGDYDYLELVAGATTLEERHGRTTDDDSMQISTLAERASMSPPAAMKEFA